MAKILLTIAGLLILAFIIVAMYCAMVVAGRSDEKESNGDNNEGADEMNWKRQICPKCKIGKWSYDLDKRSMTCPYIKCWKDGKCHFYEPFDMLSKQGIFKENKNKVTN